MLGKLSPTHTHRAVYLVSLTLCDCCVRLQRALPVLSQSLRKMERSFREPAAARNWSKPWPKLHSPASSPHWDRHHMLLSSGVVFVQPRSSRRVGSQIFVTAGTLISLLSSRMASPPCRTKITLLIKNPHMFFNPYMSKSKGECLLLNFIAREDELRWFPHVCRANELQAWDRTETAVSCISAILPTL